MTNDDEKREIDLSIFIKEHLPPTSRAGKAMQRVVKRLEAGESVTVTLAQNFTRFTAALVELEEVTRALEAELGPEH